MSGAGRSLRIIRRIWISGCVAGDGILPKWPGLKSEPTKLFWINDAVDDEFSELLAKRRHPIAIMFWVAIRIVGLDYGPGRVKRFLHGCNLLVVALSGGHGGAPRDRRERDLILSATGACVVYVPVMARRYQLQAQAYAPKRGSGRSRLHNPPELTCLDDSGLKGFGPKLIY